MYSKKSTAQNLPPFIKGDEPVPVHVDLVEETGEPRFGHRQASALEGGLELLLVQPAVVVAVDGLEQHEQLALGGLDEDAEFWLQCLSFRYNFFRDP